MKQIDLYKFAGNDPYRIALNGIFYDEEEQAAVVTNSAILVISKKHYDPEKAGLIIDKKGSRVLYRPDKGEPYQPKYPKWQSVVPVARKGTAFPLNDLIKAYQNAANFQKNVPATYEDGMKIRRDQRTTYLAVEVQDRGGVHGDSYYIGFTYEIIKLLMLLPQEGARAYAYGPLRAIYWVNEAEGLQAIFMPTTIDKKETEKAMADGFFNSEPNDGLYLGRTIVTCDRYGSAERLFRTPEKPERIPTYKCLGEDNNNPAVHLHPVPEFTKVDGTESFYTRKDPKEKSMLPQLYKHDAKSGFFVYCGYAPSNRDRLMEVLSPLDGMSYAEIVVAQGWNEKPSPRVAYFFKRIGQPIPAAC